MYKGHIIIGIHSNGRCWKLEVWDIPDVATEMCRSQYKWVAVCACTDQPLLQSPSNTELQCNATVSSLSRYLRIYTVSTVLLPPGFRQRAVRAGCSQLPSGQCPYHNANYSTPHHHCTTAAITTLIRHKFLFTWLTLWRPRHRYLTHIYISTYLPSPHIRMHAPSPVSWLKLEF